VRRALVPLSGLAAAVALLVPAPAAAAGGAYVALGDSYSSGTGTRSYLLDGTTCQRSVLAYPSLLATSQGYALDLRACAGATVADVSALQLGALGPGTTHVTLSVGGNDAGFAAVLTECAKPAWASNCGAAVDRAEAFIRGTLPARLTSLYAAVRARAPQAEVVVAGYPRVFSGVDCNALTWFSATEMARLNGTADLLNATTAGLAARAGFTFGDPTSAFTGHAVCSSSEWVNGLSSPVAESYHPNRLGHASGYAPVVGASLTGAPVAVTAATVQLAQASAEEQTARQRPRAAQDRRITPKPFRLPDLSSPQVRAAAARAGVDLRSRASIDAADRAHGARQDAGR
jgi:lysophospholipase L1-like esterase